ncbi:hypothetical protein B0J17DRAFT_674532 [Rhizoctonia solani]|nr:hypothetical protein B0J17DRAFT_674532 [Rhizoctonia solani]
MARRGQPDVELAENTYTECWDQFQTWASRHTSETLRFDHLSILDDEDEEELDENLFHAGSRNHTVHQTERELRACYYDPIEIDLEDDLLEPALGSSPTSPHWINTFTTNRIPEYSSFTHLRQHNYIRGDRWANRLTGERIRIISGEDEEVEEEEQGRNKGKNKKEEDREPPVEIKESLMDPIVAQEKVQSRTLVNLEVEDHPAISQESMPFVPPEMRRRSDSTGETLDNREALLKYEGSFIDTEAWHHFDVGWDNDEDIIGAETVRRLLHIHQMAEERVDRTKVIPQGIRRLYNLLRHRTYPDLDVVFPRDPPLPDLPLDEWAQKDNQATLESRIREKAFNICHKINCQGVMCPTHYTARERALTEQEAHETHDAQEADMVIRRGRGPQAPRWEKPKLSAQRLFIKFKREKRARCGENCFYSLGVPEHADLSFDVTEPESDPDARTQADIETIWKVDPDAIPCDIAELSWDKVTCREAYNIRNRLYSYLLEPEPDDDDPGIEERRGGHSGGQVKRKIYPTLEECDHPGPCVNNPYCPCNTSNRHCVRDCRCDLDCKHRRIGCNCKPSSKSNLCQGCKCSKHGLECDPELCKGCKARDGAPCTNIAILMKQWKPTIVKPSQHGNGLFLAGNAVKNDLIADYTGDICLPRTSMRRSLVAKANNRNYLFDIPNYSKVSIDAAYAGNESRFANHPNNGHANCSARYVWSGGEKHIALYATHHIWDGNELFLHYGSNFWSDDNQMPQGDYGGERPSEQESESGSDVEIIEEEEEEGERGYSDESIDL